MDMAIAAIFTPRCTREVAIAAIFTPRCTREVAIVSFVAIVAISA
jgi:hypothetical protein